MAKPGAMTSVSETEDTIPAGSVVVAVDGSYHAEQALAWAAEEARVRRCPLAIVHVERPLGAQERAWLAQAGMSVNQVAEEMRAGSHQLLDNARRSVAATVPDVQTQPVLRTGDAREVLLELSRRAGIVVLGSRGRGPVTSLLLGSVSVAVTRHAEGPVVVLRPREEGVRPRGVLVATDGTDKSAATLESAFQEAAYRDLPLTVAHCQWEALAGPGGWRAARPDDSFYAHAQTRVADVLAGPRGRFPGVTVAVELLAGQVDNCVADLSREHELTVIGRHAHTLLERVGSISLTTAIVEHSCGPVLVVP